MLKGKIKAGGRWRTGGFIHDWKKELHLPQETGKEN